MRSEPGGSAASTSPKRDRDFGGAIVYGAGLAGAAALAYVFNAAMGRRLSPTDFGTFGALLAVLLALSGPSAALFGGGAMSAVRRGEVPRLRWLPWLVGLSVATVIVALLPLPAGARAAFWFAEAATIWFVTSWNRGLLIGLGRLWLVGGTILLEAACRLGFALLLVGRGWGLPGAAAGLALGMTSAAAVSRLLLPKARGRPREAVTPDVWVAIFGLVCLGLVQFPDVIGVRLFDAHRSGMYNAASGIARVALYAQGPAAAYALRRAATHGPAQALRRAIPLALVPAGLVFLAVEAIPRLALSTTYGGRYVASAGVLRVLTLAMIVSGLETVLINACMGAGRTSWVWSMSTLSIAGTIAILFLGGSLMVVAVADLVVQTLLLGLAAVHAARAARFHGRITRGVLFLNWRDTRHPQGGGSEVYVETIARRLAAAGRPVTIFCAAHGSARREEVVDGVRFVRRGSWLTVYAWAAWYHVTGKLEPHDVVVDVQNAVPFFSTLYAGRPVVVLVHHVHREQWRMLLGPRVARVGWWIESRVAPRVQRRRDYVAVSMATKIDLVALGVDPDRIEIAPNGTPDAAAARRDAIDRAPVPTIVYLGRLVPHKRVEALFAAARALREDFARLHVDVVGQGAWERRLRAEVRRLGLEDIVEFHGFVKEDTKLRLLSNAWVMALPSVKEGWGLAVSEAAACGTPTVAFRVGGLQESIVDGETGTLAGDQDEFVAGLRAVLASPELRERMGAAARARATTFDWDRPTQVFEALFDAESGIANEDDRAMLVIDPSGGDAARAPVVQAAGLTIDLAGPTGVESLVEDGAVGE